MCDLSRDDGFVGVCFVGFTNAGQSGPSATDTLGAGAETCQRLVADFVGAGAKRGKPSGLAVVTGLWETQPWVSGIPHFVSNSEMERLVA